MFCKPEVKLILEGLWAENGRAEIRQGTVVILRKTEGSRSEVCLVQHYTNTNITSS